MSLRAFDARIIDGRADYETGTGVFKAGVFKAGVLEIFVFVNNNMSPSLLSETDGKTDGKIHHMIAKFV